MSSTSPQSLIIAFLGVQIVKCNRQHADSLRAIVIPNLRPMSPHSRIPVFLVILAMILNGFGRAGFVLCIGDDGHLALENVCENAIEQGNVSCCDLENDSHDDTQIAGEEHCSDCTDLLLRSNLVRTRVDEAVATLLLGDPVPSAALWPQPFSSGPVSLPHVVGLSETAIPPLIGALRTVILRL